MDDVGQEGQRVGRRGHDSQLRLRSVLALRHTRHLSLQAHSTPPRRRQTPDRHHHVLPYVCLTIYVRQRHCYRLILGRGYVYENKIISARKYFITDHFGGPGSAISHRCVSMFTG